MKTSFSDNKKAVSINLGIDPSSLLLIGKKILTEILQSFLLTENLRSIFPKDIWRKNQRNAARLEKIK